MVFLFPYFERRMKATSFFHDFSGVLWNYGAPAPLTAPGRADFAAGSTGEEPSESNVGLGIPSFCEPLCPYFISNSHQRAWSGHKVFPQLRAHQHKAVPSPGGV